MSGTRTTYPPEPSGLIIISGSFDGSLLVPVTFNDPEASPDSASRAVTVATCTNFSSGGQRVQPGAGSPEKTGGVLSIFTESDLGASAFPALSMAKYDRPVVPSAVIIT